MLLDLPPSLCPNQRSESPSTSSISIYNVDSRQHLTFVDEEEEGQLVGAVQAKEVAQRRGSFSERANRKRGQQPAILRFRLSAITLLAPLLLSPLLFSNESEYKCSFCVALMAVYWMGEVMPLAVTALLPAVIFPMSGILSARDVSKEFLNDSNFLFLGGLIMATAVEKCGLHERIALKVMTLVGSQPSRIMLGFMSITAALSMFISNTATTAMMLPIGQSVIALLGSGGKTEAGRLLPEGLEKPADSESNKRMAKGLLMSIAFAANIGGVGTLTGTPPNLVLVGMLSSLFPGTTMGINYLSWMAITQPLMLVCLLLCWLLLALFFLRNAPSADQQIGQMMRKRERELPPMNFAQKSVALCFILLFLLWIGREPGFIPGIGSLFARDFFTDSTSAMLVAILLFLLPSENPFTRSKIGQENDEPNGGTGRLMDWPTMQRQFPWSVVLLLGGGFALAAGVRESGLSKLIGLALGQLEDQPVWLLQLICVFVTMFVTNICSNTVTASIFIPIVASMAQRSGGIHPLALMLPTTLACSFAFVLPVGSPSNAIVFSSGLLSVPDMVFSGLAISAASALATMAYLAAIAPLIFPVENFPILVAISGNGTEEGMPLFRHISPEPAF